LFQVTRSLFRRSALAAALAAAWVGGPLAAQGAAMYSEGYEFLKAVRDRDGTKVTEALSEPGSTIVGSRDLTSGETALHIVTQRRDLAWIRFLIQHGANPNVEDKKGVTPLTIASNLGFAEGVEALLDAGARIDEPNAAGETPLISAVHRRDVGLVRTLLAHGANPDRNDNSGRSARDYADLMGSDQLLDEFKRADAAREGAAKSYGPGA
jgi:ankyrin repeat protein